MTTMLMDIPELLGRRHLRMKEVGVLLGFGPSKVGQLISSGRLRSVKIDGARRIPVDAIEEFLARCESSNA